MKNKTWYLFRHALATRNSSGYGDKIISADILQEETEPIRRMSAFLITIHQSYNVVSEYKRCRQTAQIVTTVTNKQFIVDPRINEYHQTTFPQFNSRIASWMEDMESKPEDNIIACTHGAVISFLRHFLTVGNASDTSLSDYPKCGELCIVHNKSVQLIDYN